MGEKPKQISRADVLKKIQLQMNCSGVGTLPYLHDQQITDIFARSVVSSHFVVALYGKVLWLQLYIGLKGGCRRFKTFSDLRNMNSACFYMILPSHAGFKC